MEDVYGVSVDRKLEATEIDSWSEWKAAWNTATQSEVCVGLLHRLYTGFYKQRPDYMERDEILLSLLALSDGHNAPGLSHSTRKIRAKALEVLIAKLAKDEIWDQIKSQEIFDAFLYFFRPRRAEPYGGSILNLSYVGTASTADEARIEKAREFARKLCQTIWYNSYRYIRWEERRADILEMAVALKLLGDFIPHANSHAFMPPDYQLGNLGIAWKKFDDACLERLESLVKTSGYTSIEDGVWQGNTTAQLLFLVKAGKIAQAKADEVDRLQKQAAEAQQGLQKLGVA